MINNDVEINIKSITLPRVKELLNSRRTKNIMINPFSHENRIVLIFLFLNMLNQELNNSLTLVVITIKPANKRKIIE